MTIDIPISQIVENPFNSRIMYDSKEIRSLAHSMENNGLILPIRVRKIKESEKVDPQYEIVYGHRRFRAAKFMNWKSIKAEVETCSNKESMIFSLVENMERKDISDYEMGLSFFRMNREFGMSYEVIGNLVGRSRGHICNLVRMTQLFDEGQLSKSPDLVSSLCAISEHHGRLLSQINDLDNRMTALKLIIQDKLSVRETQIMIHRLRSWFRPSNSIAEGDMDNLNNIQGKIKTPHDSPDILSYSQLSRKQNDGPESEIIGILYSALRGPRSRDFDSFSKFYAFESGYSLYPYFPPQNLSCKIVALNRKRDWFYFIAPNLSAQIRDVRIQFHSDLALATLYVDYASKRHQPRFQTTIRGTVVLIREAGLWKILHEHWSRLESDDELVPVRKLLKQP